MMAMQQIFRELQLALVGLWSLWIVWGGLASAEVSVYTILPFLFVLTAIWPRFGLALFFVAALPLGGAYPGTVATAFFLRALGGVSAGLWLRHIWFLATFGVSPLPVSLRQPLHLSLVIFSMTAVGSLIAIPMDEWGIRFSQLGAMKAHAIIEVKETWVLYSLLKCMVIMTGLGLTTMFVEEVRRGSVASPRFLLLGGLGSYALTLGLGLLDYFGVLSLTWLREIATGVKSDGSPLRLQSLFGHPAWCAMYVSALAPTVVVMFDLRMRPWIANALVITLLVIGEYVLILTFARGGWVSYPFTLLAIWVCIYTLGVKNKRGVLPRSLGGLWRKIIISLPITVLLSVGITLVSEHGDYERYANRLKAVANTADRTVYIDPALKLAKEHPILGGGVGAFAYRYTNDFVIPTGKYFSPTGGPLNRTFNNAHSLWLGVLVGQGVMGVLAMGGILLATGWTTREVLKGIGKQATTPATGLFEPLAWVALLCSAVSFGIYGIFDDTFYPPSNVIVLFFLAGIALSSSREPLLLPVVLVKRVLVIVFLGFIAQGVFEFIFPGQARHLTIDPGSDGCYRRPQEITDGRFGVWCSEHAQIEAPIRVVEGQVFASIELAVPPYEGRAPEIEVSLADTNSPVPILRTPSAPEGEPFWLLIPLAAEYSAMHSVKLDLQFSSYLVPLRNPKIQSLDRRRLAFSVPLSLTAFSENAGNDARCIEILTSDIGWRDFWCAGGGLIPVPKATNGGLDVSVRLPEGVTAARWPVNLAFSGGGLESSMITLTGARREIILKNFDPQATNGLRIASTQPARLLDPSGRKGFVVGFRMTTP